jgi:DNA-binding MarR family transcriptional regulator
MDTQSGTNSAEAGTNQAQTGTNLDEISARLALAVGRINRRIRSSRDGLSHGLVSSLSSIVRIGPLRPGELGRLEAVAAPTITRVVGDLERRGLIERTPDPSDGRSFLISATPEGVDVVLRARSERAERIAALLSNISPEELVAIDAALTALEAAAVVKTDSFHSPRERGVVETSARS